jgi:hypothetical protein
VTALAHTAVWLAVTAGATLLAGGLLALALAVIGVASGRLVTGMPPRRRQPWEASWENELDDFAERRVALRPGVVRCHRCGCRVRRDPARNDVELLSEHLARWHPEDRWQAPRQ